MIGGETDTARGSAMAGAALLAAGAALHGGAGRVYVSLLGDGAPMLDAAQPELMFRRAGALDLPALTVVCGCGGGEAVRDVLPAVLAQAPRLVLDADALNAIAADAALQAALQARAGQATVLTPHPLEAARLLGTGTRTVQGDRLRAAMELAERFRCGVVLKGSGSVIAAPGQVPRINPTGNARLATAGTGDVLAGLAGALLAGGGDAFGAACAAAYRHGALANAWPADSALTAGALARRLTP
ncbi:NAD(P)H-hydrate dehydratase [Ottowia testudinis]|uniref:NAD(P)H-hydrate dehydratase n=1 Tax=Ottowia testudinis TaxID=2816950 RepID=UPI003264020A